MNGSSAATGCVADEDKSVFDPGPKLQDRKYVEVALEEADDEDDEEDCNVEETMKKGLDNMDQRLSESVGEGNNTIRRGERRAIGGKERQTGNNERADMRRLRLSLARWANQGPGTLGNRRVPGTFTGTRPRKKRAKVPRSSRVPASITLVAGRPQCRRRGQPTTTPQCASKKMSHST